MANFNPPMAPIIAPAVPSLDQSVENVSMFKTRTKAKEHWSSKLPKLPVIEHWLLEQKKITLDQFRECSNIAREEGISFTTAAVEKGYVLERVILNFYAERLGIDYIDTFTKKSLDDLDFNAGFFGRFDTTVLDNMNIIPLKYESTDTSSVIQMYQVHVVMSDPWQLREVMNVVSNVVRMMNLEVMQHNKGVLKQNNGLSAESEYELLNEEPQIDIITYLAKAGEIKQVLQETSNTTVEVLDESDKEEAEALRQWMDIINKAIKQKVTDIHVMPVSSKGGLSVRYRVDGDLEDVTKTIRYSKLEYEVLLNKIMNMANLNTTMKARPQSGSFQHLYEKQLYDLRVEVIYNAYNTPTFDANKVVLRILNNADSISVKDLGMTPEDLEIVQAMYERPSGMMLATGPTSSGKSTTIFAILQQLDLVKKCCYTAEDPVEYHLENACQIPVSAVEGRSYGDIIRSLMRLDPDILYLGEMRDNVSAEAAVQIANTGHTVFSTLHTNSSYSVPQRLSSLGVKTHLMASALSGVIAQRLVRKNCPHCLEAYKPSQHTMDRLELSSNETYYRGSGHTAAGTVCPFCRGRGYKGRMGIFEIMPLYKHYGWEKMVEDPVGLRDMMLGSGYRDLYGDAMLKVRNKEVSPDNLVGIIAPVSDADAAKVL
ncbi:GspE/PulE family protein [uncultured Cloacibacillus sp.]|uniref:GspE/PulE family protein n=1 Tax=uncultured Cloacibacillus sp. TaxID=889794 RepID=UPI0026DCC64F|nr:GspE/PulE family protein [uncultured Cloacibacillus sp.]